MKKSLAFFVVCGAAAAYAGVPIKWSVETSRAEERVIEVYHGESLDMEVTFKSYGEILELPTNEVAATFWQTNGMNTAYWRTNNVEIVSSNGIMRTTFGPEQDVGAKTLRGFIGIAGQIYRAAFVLRFKDAPGYNPTIVEWPYRRLDFDLIEIVNPPYYTKDEMGEVITNTVTAEFVNERVEEKDPTVKDATNELDRVIRGWAEEEFQKSWQLEEVELGKGATANGTKTTAIGAYAEADGISGVALGNGAKAKGTYPIAVGLYATATNNNGVAVGAYADAGNGGVSAGQNAKTGAAGVGIGSNAQSGQYGIAIGLRAKAGEQSVAIGRDASATHTGAVAIGPMAQTQGDNQMHWAFLPSEIYLGYGGIYKSLQSYFNDLTPPDIDWEELTNLVKNADFVPSKFYRPNSETLAGEIKCEVSQLGNKVTTRIEPVAGTQGNNEVVIRLGTNVSVIARSGSGISVNKGAKVTIRDLDSLEFGTTGAIKSLPTIIAENESDPTISSWAKQPTKPTYTASEVGATTAADVYRLVAGTNVVLVVTNYNSATHAPAMKLQHLDPESGQYVTYWDEMRQHGITYTKGTNYTDAAIAERAAPRAWSGTTSGLGSEAPAGVTWISTPETVIAGGFEYEKVVTSAGAVWVLTSNGMSAGATSNSFFRVAASDGTELFSIEKTDSYLIGVNADGITRSGNTVTIPINVVAAEHPYIRCTKNLVNPTWVKEDEGGLDCDWATVSWSGTTGAYVATVTTAEPQAFFYFEYMVEGQVKIKNSAKTEMSGGILFNGTTYLPTVNGNKLEFVAQ